jgi:hemerythrin superfamily protein
MPNTAKSATASKAAKARRTRRTGARDPLAVKLLKQDHRQVEGWFDEYEQLDADGEKLALFKEIALALKVHTRIEEEIFYPAVIQVLPKEQDLLDEAQVEHDGAKSLIDQLDGMKPGDDLFDAKVTVLAEYIKHHVKEEHEDMFPKVRRTKLDLNELGMRLAFRKRELAKQVK